MASRASNRWRCGVVSVTTNIDLRTHSASDAGSSQHNNTRGGVNGTSPSHYSVRSPCGQHDRLDQL